MYSIKKGLNFSGSEKEIKRIGLKYLNLFKREPSNANSPIKSVLRKSLTKNQLLFSVNSPNSTLHSKIKYTPSKFNLSNSLSLTKDTKLDHMRKTYLLNNKQNFFSKNLLLPKNLNVKTPKIKGLKLNNKISQFKPSVTYFTRKIMKNSFSINNKATNASSMKNIKFNLDKSTPSVKSVRINFSQNFGQSQKEINKAKDEINYQIIEDEKNIFEKKLKKKKREEIYNQNVLYRNRKKYPFVKISTHSKFQISSDIPETISKINKKLTSLLLKESMGIFQHPINIIKKGQFSQKYENPRDIEYEKKEGELYNTKNILFGEYILKDEIVKKEENIIKIYDRKAVLSKFKKKIMEIYLINQNLIIPMSEIIQKYKLSNNIINYDQTRHLNFYIKLKDLKSALLILSANHHIAIDFDQFYMTPLHIAVKKNFYQIIPYLLRYGAYVDAKNSFGVTPLIICLKKNFYESMMILFLYLANPFLELKKNKNINEKEINYSTKNIIERIKLIHIKNRLLRDTNYYKSVKKGVYKFIINECGDLVEEEFLSFIKIIYKLENN